VCVTRPVKEGFSPAASDGERHRSGVPGREHAAPSEGRLGPGEPAHRPHNRRAQDGERRQPACCPLGLVLGPGAAGESSWALNRLRESEQIVECLSATGLAPGGRRSHHALGRACLLLGRLDEARNLGHRAVEVNRAQPGFAADALHLLGDIATHPDRFDAEGGEANYLQALALAEPRGMRPLVAHCHLGLARLFKKRGKRQEAGTYLAVATTMYRDMDMPFWLEKAMAEMSVAETWQPH
jgi:hypothetical protein